MAPLGIAVNLLMMLFLPWDTWLRLLGWLAVGLVIYFIYGRRHSVLLNSERVVLERPRLIAGKVIGPSPNDERDHQIDW